MYPMIISAVVSSLPFGMAMRVASRSRAVVVIRRRFSLGVIRDVEIDGVDSVAPVEAQRAPDVQDYYLMLVAGVGRPRVGEGCPRATAADRLQNGGHSTHLSDHLVLARRQHQLPRFGGCSLRNGAKQVQVNGEGSTQEDDDDG